jgi:thioredoxin 1
MLDRIMPDIQAQTNATITPIDVDAQSEVAAQYGVRNVPTVIIEKDGQEVQRIVGVQSASTYVNAINSLK